MADIQEVFNTMVLARLNYFSLAGLVRLYREAGSASVVMEHRHDIREVLPDASERLIDALRHCDDAMKRAEIELQFDLDHNILPLTLNDDHYPVRLRECDDAPLVLFYRGSAALNRRHVINIVGTRRCTSYGKDLVRRFVADLKQYDKELLIVSGLAYGIDIAAHRESLANGIDTVGVLAHGLDELYPTAHRDTAKEMVAHGGVLTEYMTQTMIDKRNFVQRNRIVAGMSDACVVVESAAKGGALITANISHSYGRDVFAFPGAIGASSSEGCNNLIRDNKASLITSADDFINAMGWEDSRGARGKEQGTRELSLFPELSAEEQSIVTVLRQTNDLQLNLISVKTNIPIGRLTAILFELEMKGVVKPLAGGVYHCIV